MLVPKSTFYITLSGSQNSDDLYVAIELYLYIIKTTFLSWSTLYYQYVQLGKITIFKRELFLTIIILVAISVIFLKNNNISFMIKLKCIFLFNRENILYKN